MGLRILLLLIIIKEITCETAFPSPCIGSGDDACRFKAHGKYPDCDDCHKFVVCLFDHRVDTPCRVAGAVYERSSGKCRLDIGCGGDSQDETPPGASHGPLPQQDPATTASTSTTPTATTTSPTTTSTSITTILPSTLPNIAAQIIRVLDLLLPTLTTSPTIIIPPPLNSQVLQATATTADPVGLPPTGQATSKTSVPAFESNLPLTGDVETPTAAPIVAPRGRLTTSKYVNKDGGIQLVKQSRPKGDVETPTSTPTVAPRGQLTTSKYVHKDGGIQLVKQNRPKGDAETPRPAPIVAPQLTTSKYVHKDGGIQLVKQSRPKVYSSPCLALWDSCRFRSDGQYPSCSTCSTRVVCRSGVKDESWCPSGNLYDRYLGRCRSWQFVQCFGI